MITFRDLLSLFLGLSIGLFLPVLSVGLALGLGTLLQYFQNRRSLPRTFLYDSSMMSKM